MVLFGCRKRLRAGLSIRVCIAVRHSPTRASWLDTSCHTRWRVSSTGSRWCSSLRWFPWDWWTVTDHSWSPLLSPWTRLRSTWTPTLRQLSASSAASRSRMSDHWSATCLFTQATDPSSVSSAGKPSNYDITWKITVASTLVNALSAALFAVKPFPGLQYSKHTRRLTTPSTSASSCLLPVLKRNDVPPIYPLPSPVTSLPPTHPPSTCRGHLPHLDYPHSSILALPNTFTLIPNRGLF